MATTTKSPSEILTDFEERVAVAEQRRGEIGEERRAAVESVSAAEGARLSLEERRGAGEEIAQTEIDAAVEAISAAREKAAEGIWRARLNGADRAVQEAEIVRDDWGRANFVDLAAEAAQLDVPARDALVDAWKATQAAAADYAVRVRVWHRLARYGEFAIGEVANGTPLNGELNEVAAIFTAGLPLPTPGSLREQPE
jgi:hypothetical protein